MNNSSTKIKSWAQNVKTADLWPCLHARSASHASAKRCNGKLTAFTSIAVAPPYMAKEGFNRNNPYIVGVMELEEGVKTVARIVGIDAKKPEQIKVGTSLKADFIEKGEGAEKQTILVFKP